MTARHEVELIGRERCGADVVTVRFARPPGFEFKAGQWMVLALEVAGASIAETFTICSAPDDDWLEITTRLSGSAFKGALEALTPGDRATVSGPGGRLTLPTGVERFAFLVGGVGITPVRSMLRDARTHGRVFEDALLLYGNRDALCVPFGDEFSAMADAGVRMVLCYEHPPEGWLGEAGFITAETVRRHLDPHSDDRPFVVAGPPPMVLAMEVVLDELEVPVERRIVERFGPKA